jgi:hypothetical protein
VLEKLHSHTLSHGPAPVRLSLSFQSQGISDGSTLLLRLRGPLGGARAPLWESYVTPR